MESPSREVRFRASKVLELRLPSILAWLRPRQRFPYPQPRETPESPRFLLSTLTRLTVSAFVTYTLVPDPSGCPSCITMDFQ